MRLKHFIFSICIGLSIVSCNTTKEVSNNNQNVVNVDKVVERDTIRQIVHDSIFHTIYQRGDTIYNTKYVYKVRYRDKIVLRFDTIRHDSIVTKTQNVVVEKRVIPAWCYNCLLLSIILFCFFLVRCAIWLRKH